MKSVKQSVPHYYPSPIFSRMKFFQKKKHSDEEADHDDHVVDETANEERPGLALKNWLNLGAFILNTVITYGVGNVGWVGKTNGELSEKYQVR